MDEQVLDIDAAALSRQVEASMRAAMASADKRAPEAELEQIREQIANLERRIARIEEALDID